MNDHYLQEAIDSLRDTPRQVARGPGTSMTARAVASIRLEALNDIEQLANQIKERD